MFVRLDFSGETRAEALQAGSRSAGTDIVTQLGPSLPFRDESIDELFLGGALAFVDDIVATMEECWRIVRPGALVHARLPHASSPWAMSGDPRQRHAFTLETFRFFDPKEARQTGVTSAVFAIEEARLCWTGPRGPARGLALARGAVARAVETFVNQSRGMQYRWERWLAPLIGGFEEVAVVLSAVKAVPFG